MTALKNFARGAALLLLGFAGLPVGAEDLADTFQIKTGLEQPEISDRVRNTRRMYTHVLDPNYEGTVEGGMSVGNHRMKFRIQLRQQYMDGTGGESWPTLWEPDSFCETLLEKPTPLPGEHRAWILRVSHAAKTPDTGCEMMRQLGSLGGLKHIIVRHDPQAQGIGFTVEVFTNLYAEPFRGTLRQGKGVLDLPSYAIFNEASLATEQQLVGSPALITAEVTDRHGIVHPLSVHRVHFSNHKLPKLNVYDHYSGCVFERADPAADAETAPRFRLGYALNDVTVKQQCDSKKALKSHIVSSDFKDGATEAPWIGDMVFDRQGDNTYAVTIEGKDLFMSSGTRPTPAPIAHGTARLTGSGSLYVDHVPADGLRDINGYFLINNSGFYRIGEYWSDKGKKLAAYAIEVTDMVSFFDKGDAVATVSWWALDQQLSITWFQRMKDGKCPDSPGTSESLNFTITAEGYRTGMSSSPSSKERVCVAEVVRLDTCKMVRCLQWDDSMTYNQPATYLTSDETKARELWAKIYKWTRANTGLKHDPETFSETIVTGGSDSPYPFGECGLEGCEAKRNRELVDDFVRDIWSK